MAVVLAAVQTAWPSASAHVGPGVLSVASLVIDALVVRHMLRLDRASAAPWRAFAVLAALLAVGEAIAAVRGVGVNAASAGLQDVPLVAAIPFALVGCARLVRSAATGISARIVLDALVALVALRSWWTSCSMPPWAGPRARSTT